MPQLAKGGKFVYGWSPISPNGQVNLPPQVVQEYQLPSNGKLILMSSSKISGGFCVTSKAMLEHSQLSVILKDNPPLARYTLPEGKTIKYKGRQYCWVTMKDKSLWLSEETMRTYDVKSSDRLLSIRSSNIAFALIVKGPIISEAKKHSELETF